MVGDPKSRTADTPRCSKMTLQALIEGQYRYVSFLVSINYRFQLNLTKKAKPWWIFTCCAWNRRRFALRRPRQCAGHFVWEICGQFPRRGSPGANLKDSQAWRPVLASAFRPTFGRWAMIATRHVHTHAVHLYKWRH